MHKTKLQELCHRRHWQLPEYVTSSDGPTHNPRFHSTCTVNELPFTNPHPAKNSKEAQNEAAHAALLYFTNVSAGSSTSSKVHRNIQVSDQIPHVNTQYAIVKDAIGIKGSSSSSTMQPNIPASDQTPQVNAHSTVVKDPIGVENQKTLFMQNLSKNQLQSYAQKRNLSLPFYSCEREGPPHACRFKCTVTVDGKTFESPTFFPTVKEAQQEAANVALMSLSADGVQEEDSSLYKNLLQQLAQKEHATFPIYNTNQSGEPHTPTFVSTVEVEGEIFTGPEAKTKKQAEMRAAKVAYITLKERLSKKSRGPALEQTDDQCSEFPPLKQAEENEGLSKKSWGPAFEQADDPYSKFQPSKQAEENGGGNAEVISNHLLDHFPQPDFSCKSGSSSTDLSAPTLSQLGSSSSSLCAEVSSKTFTGSRTRIQVLPGKTNMIVPEGSTVVHRDEHYVALRLGSSSNK